MVVRQPDCAAGTCPMCYANRKGRSAFKGHRYYRQITYTPYIERKWYMKRPETPKGKSGGSLVCVDPALTDRRPTVTEFMTCQVWDGGGKRTTSTLSISVQDDRVVVALNDRDLKRSVYLSADTLDGALDALEADLVKDQAEWRSWAGNKKK